MNNLFKNAVNFYENKEFDKAQKVCEDILDIQPDDLNATNLLAVLNFQNKDFIKSIKLFKKAIEINPNISETYNNLGNVYYEFKQFSIAIENYNKALKIKPNFALSYYNRAKALQEVSKKQDAISDYNKAISLNKNFSKAYKNLGNLYMELKILDKSIYNHEQALKINPNISYLNGSIIQSKCGLSEWTNFKDDKLFLKNSILSGKKTTSPFPTILIYDSPSLQKKAIDIFVQNEFEKPKKIKFEKNKNKKIKIGYYSSDFHNHATMYLMANLFELHDKTKFETYAFSFGPDDGSKIRERVVKTFDKFFDVKLKTTEEIVKDSRELNLDIAIDLKGFTNNNRFDLFIERCAPIQISYLGFPGTTGSDCMDYLIADKIVIPEESKIHYSENIIYLPNSYQVNDSNPTLSKKSFSKKDFNLPENKFIFCCFNHSFKILPEMFEIWIKILKKVKNSIIWLLIDNEITQNNLKKILVSNDIDPNRIIFADRLPHSEHIVRLGLADLFLDTFPCNAHTTASDALRSSLPIITIKGDSFASRVASSLLVSVGLEELITKSQKEYEELAIKIAVDKNFYKEIRDKLKKNVKDSPLFNSKLFTKKIEEAYQMVCKNYTDNKKSEIIEIK
tara:strand:+ start:137 stop:1999 length:1863 start_codon:yes stop_codon:yes gene_type:complete